MRRCTLPADPSKRASPATLDQDITGDPTWYDYRGRIAHESLLARALHGVEAPRDNSSVSSLAISSELRPAHRPPCDPRLCWLDPLQACLPLLTVRCLDFLQLQLNVPAADTNMVTGVVVRPRTRRHRSTERTLPCALSLPPSLTCPLLPSDYAERTCPLAHSVPPPATGSDLRRFEHCHHVFVDIGTWQPHVEHQSTALATLKPPDDPIAFQRTVEIAYAAGWHYCFRCRAPRKVTMRAPVQSAGPQWSMSWACYGPVASRPPRPHLAEPLLPTSRPRPRQSAPIAPRPLLEALLLASLLKTAVSYRLGSLTD